MIIHKCSDCRWWGKSKPALSKDWKKCENPAAPGFDFWREAKNTLCNGYFEAKEEASRDER